MNEFCKSVLETLVGNFALTGFLIYYNEYLNPKKNISGAWETEITIEDTTYGKYKGVKIQYKIFLLQKGTEITGHGEKISDIDKERGLYEFEPEKRVHIDIQGYYERNYLKKSIVYFNIIEEGRLRNSTESCFLIVKTNSSLTGVYTTTAANASGKIVMQKNDQSLQ